MSSANGVVDMDQQVHPEPAPETESAGTAGTTGEQRSPAGASAAAVGASERYQEQFFAVLQDIVAANTTAIKTPRRLFGDTTDVVARLVTLSRKVDDGGNPALYRQAYFAAMLWKANPSIASTVRAVIEDIEFSSSRNSPIYTVLYGLMLSLLSLSLGAFTFCVLSSFVYAWSSARPWQEVISGPYLHVLTSPVVVAATFGMLGAVVSVLLRLSEFEHATRRSRQFLRMTGVVLPVVGVVFASVTCALFASGMINFSFAVGSDHRPLLANTYFFIVIGFLAGFSERFTRGLLGTAEKSLMTTHSTAQTTLRTAGATRDMVTQSTNVIKQQAPAA
jgi:hypothetical protein